MFAQMKDRDNHGWTAGCCTEKACVLKRIDIRASLPFYSCGRESSVSTYCYARTRISKETLSNAKDVLVWVALVAST